jgi:hypothetical protein
MSADTHSELSPSEQAIAVIQKRCPELSGRVLIINRFKHDDLMSAIEDAATDVEPRLTEAIRQQLGELYPEELEMMVEHFAGGGAFNLPLDLKPDEVPAVGIMSPFQVIDDLYAPHNVLSEKISWHRDLGRTVDPDAIAEQDFRHMRAAAWHEAGHAVAEARGHNRVFEPLPAPAELDGVWPETVAHMARQNADEQYADGYSLRQIGSEDPDLALDTAREFSDWRAVNLMCGMIQSRPDTGIYCTNNAVTAAIRDIATYVENGGKIRDPGSDGIAKATRDAVLAGRHDPEDLAELKVKGDALRQALTINDRHFAQQLGMTGNSAEGAPTYYFARDYLAAMDRLLPDDHPMREPFARAAQATTLNRHAVIWDRQNPPVEVSATAARLKIKRAARRKTAPDAHTRPSPGGR